MCWVQKFFKMSKIITFGEDSLLNSACVCVCACAWARVCARVCVCVPGQVCSMGVGARVHVHVRACLACGCACACVCAHARVRPGWLSPARCDTRARDVRSWQRQRRERRRRDSHYDAVTVTVTAFDERSPIKPPERESESFSKASVRERTFLLPRLTYRLHLAN